MEKLVLIDSNAIIHRAYHALPKTMSTRSGELTNAVYGYTTTLIKVLEDLKPDYIAASFDVSRATFRLAEYKEYKAKRVKADQELYDQIPRVRELLEVLNISVYEQEGFEADDVIGTIVESCSTKLPTTNYKLEIYIVTGDKDAFQLIDGNIFVYNLKGGLSQVQIVDRAAIERDWHLQPEDFIDLKALAGDPSDNIPGVPGIGPKTATELLIKFDTLEKLYEKIDSIVISTDAEKSCEDPKIFPLVSPSRDDNNEEVPTDELEIEKLIENRKLKIENLSESALEKIAKELELKPRIIRLLLENKDQAFLSQRLATIRRDVPLDFDLEKCRFGDYDKEKVTEFFKRMQFHSLLKRFGIEKGEEAKTKEAKEQKAKDEQLKLL